jgi:hypothetical protein
MAPHYQTQEQQQHQDHLAAAHHLAASSNEVDCNDHSNGNDRRYSCEVAPDDVESSVSGQEESDQQRLALGQQQQSQPVSAQEMR